MHCSDRVAIRRRKKKESPYWLAAPHEEHCAGCDHTHAYAVTARCVACDRGFCSVCIMVVAGQAFCTECHDEGGP